MKNILLCIIALCMVVSCDITTSKLPVIDVQTTKTIDISSVQIDTANVCLLSDIADSISYIYLSNDTMIPDITGILHGNDGSFLIHAGSTVYNFNSDGTYIGQLFQNGRGPLEAVCYTAPVNNPIRSSITVNDNFTNKYKIYRYDGTLINTNPKYCTSDEREIMKVPVGYVNNLEVFYTQQHSGKKFNPSGRYLMQVRDIDTDSIIYRYENVDSSFMITKQGMASVGRDIELFFGKVGERYWFNRRGIDTIYTTSDFVTDIQAAYVLNIGRDVNHYKELMRLLYADDVKSIMNNTTVYDVRVTSRFIFIAMSKNNTYGYVCYDLEHNKPIVTARKFRNDIDNTIDLQMGTTMLNGYLDNDMMICPINAYKLGHIKSSRVKTVNENDNPVLMVVHLKK